MAQKQGQDIEDEVNKEVGALKKSEYNEWRSKTQQTLTELATKMTNDTPADRDKKISAALQGILDDFKKNDGISEVLLKAKLAAYT